MNRILWGGMIFVFTSVLSSGTFAQLECGVYNGACPDANYVNLFQMSDLSSAHASVDDSYPYKVCCIDPSVLLGTNCSGAVAITVLRLASASNAHVGNGSAPYPIEVCFSAPAGSSLFCEFVNDIACPLGETCVVATSDSINAQVSDGCSDPAIPWRVCCSSSPAPAVCGDGVQDPGEDCDPPDDANCPSLCQADCSCPAPFCGNDVQELGEECDGTDDAACPGVCQAGCTCPVAPSECDWDIAFNTETWDGFEHTFDVTATDNTDYTDGSMDCLDQIVGGKTEMQFDIWIKGTDGDLDDFELTLVGGGIISDVGQAFRISITVPVYAGIGGNPPEQVGTLYMKIPDAAVGSSRVTVTADKTDPGHPFFGDEIGVSGAYTLSPIFEYSLCPVCNVEDVPYLLYHAGYTPGPGMDVQKTCDEATGVISQLEGPDYCGGGNCPPESLVYLETARRYYSVGADILDSGATSQSLLEQADRYCLEAGTFARDGIYALCARIGNPQGCT